MPDYYCLDSSKKTISTKQSECSTGETSLYTTTGETVFDTNRNEIVKNTGRLYQLPNTDVDSASQMYSATMVAGTIWTVFASVLVYYVFTEI